MAGEAATKLGYPVHGRHPWPRRRPRARSRSRKPRQPGPRSLRQPATTFPTALGKIIHHASISHAGVTAMTGAWHFAAARAVSILIAATSCAGSIALQSSWASTASMSRAAASCRTTALILSALVLVVFGFEPLISTSGWRRSSTTRLRSARIPRTTCATARRSFSLSPKTTTTGRFLLVTARFVTAELRRDSPKTTALQAQSRRPRESPRSPPDRLQGYGPAQCRGHARNARARTVPKEA